MEFNTEFLQFSSLGTFIYRLQVQMSVWLEKPRRRPDGQLCDQLSKFHRNSFLNLVASGRFCLVVRTIAP